MHKEKTDVIIIGGGLAGLCSAIHLSKHQYKVILVEKQTYPRHKVCGEYVSNEVLPYLDTLGFNPFNYGAKRISKFELTTHNNKTIKANLPLGGFGMSRYQMDLQLYKLALKDHVEIIEDTVTNVEIKDHTFAVSLKLNKEIRAKIVIGAYGKRSNLDLSFNRPFIRKKSPYLAVKMHVSGDFPDNKVALHNFNGGYCGVSKIENDHINLCYITNYKTFKAYKNIDKFQKKVLFKNEALKQLFKTSTLEFEKPLTISQISFKTKKPVENHILMCGDAAGMIHPLCGNGMAMAIKGAQLVSEVIINYFEGHIKTRETLERTYTKQWKQQFAKRLKVGHGIAYLFRKEWLAPHLLSILRRNTFLIPKIIKQTHGN